MNNPPTTDYLIPYCHVLSIKSPSEIVETITSVLKELNIEHTYNNNYSFECVTYIEFIRMNCTIFIYTLKEDETYAIEFSRNTFDSFQFYDFYHAIIDKLKSRLLLTDNTIPNKQTSQYKDLKDFNDIKCSEKDILDSIEIFLNMGESTYLHIKTQALAYLSVTIRDHDIPELTKDKILKLFIKNLNSGDEDIYRCSITGLNIIKLNYNDILNILDYKKYIDKSATNVNLEIQRQGKQLLNKLINGHNKITHITP